ncbi:Os11g0626700 [Oryza sativa Japonica Group]|uniref:Os11g0626700 protein n=1 Tax=Oryza sativa subsp. japonica TaxID=39947 RepID=A0A0P0Y4K9_ORYSJ|nr:Os11g0626700 [Oryza sativa Japonica Group]
MTTSAIRLQSLLSTLLLVFLLLTGSNLLLSRSASTHRPSPCTLDPTNPSPICPGQAPSPYCPQPPCHNMNHAPATEQQGAHLP